MNQFWTIPAYIWTFRRDFAQACKNEEHERYINAKNQASSWNDLEGLSGVICSLIYDAEKKGYLRSGAMRQVKDRLQRGNDLPRLYDPPQVRKYELLKVLSDSILHHGSWGTHQVSKFLSAAHNGGTFEHTRKDAEGNKKRFTDHFERVRPGNYDSTEFEVDGGATWIEFVQQLDKYTHSHQILCYFGCMVDQV